MAIRRKWMNYTVYAPEYKDGKGCWDYRTVVKARLAAKNLGIGSRLRRNINLRNKGEPEAGWWVDRGWEWTRDSPIALITQRGIDTAVHQAVGAPRREKLPSAPHPPAT